MSSYVFFTEGGHLSGNSDLAERFVGSACEGPLYNIGFFSAVLLSLF